jgi:hypothetical protein
MYAQGMHLRVRSAEEEKVTCDSGIAASVSRGTSGRSRGNPACFQAHEYIGWIEEIVELDYRSHCCAVLVCSWVRATPEVEGGCVTRDRFGFTLGNFSNPLPLGAQSSVFPRQCQQVFFLDDAHRNETHGGNWKVVCGTEVRGRRGHFQNEITDLKCLSTGSDADFP